MKATEQHLINREEIFFELKKITEDHGVRCAAVLHNCEFSENTLIRHLAEMGIKLTALDMPSVSYDRAEVEGLLDKADLGDTQLIIAAGDGTLINAVKHAAASGRTGGKPVIAIPSSIESGEEANGRVIFFNNEGISVTTDDKAMPEYVFYDKDFINTEKGEHTNTCLAKGICQAANVIWTQDHASEAAATAAEGLRKIFDNITKVMRSDKAGYDGALEGARLVGMSVGLAGEVSLDEAAMVFASRRGTSLGQAMMNLSAPVSIFIEDQLNKNGMDLISASEYKKAARDKDESFKEMYGRFSNLGKVMASGNRSMRGLSDQFSFVEFALGLIGECLETDEILSMEGTFDRSLFRDLPAVLSDEDVRLFLLHVFHRETLGRAVKKYEFNISSGGRAFVHRENARLLREKFKDDPSDDRIIKEPYYAERITRQKLVKGLQKEVLETLLLSKKFLEENGLTYYLSEGTMLGAVRHKGFIPWDDDVDIMMPRDDYNKLVELDKKGLVPPELHFDALENNPKHWVLGAKLQLTRESEFVQPKVAGLSEFNGPYIDVFPLDYWDSPYSKKQYKAQRIVKACRRMLFIKTGYSREVRGKLHRRLMILLLPFIPNTVIEKKAIQYMTMFNGGKRSHMVHLTSYYPFYKEVFPASCYGKPVYLEFEGHMFPVPKEYDFMLRTIYGNKYDSLPPARVAGSRNHPFESTKDQ